MLCCKLTSYSLTYLDAVVWLQLQAGIFHRFPFDLSVSVDYQSFNFAKHVPAHLPGGLESVLRKYAIDLARLIDDIDAGAFVGYSLEGPTGTQSIRV